MSHNSHTHVRLSFGKIGASSEGRQDNIVAIDDSNRIWNPDWDALAGQMVQTMCIESAERVVLYGDPSAWPEPFEAVRVHLLRIGAIDHATVPAWQGRLGALRDSAGRNPDPMAARREAHALLDLLRTADVFLWLPNDWYGPGSSNGVSEWALARWRGRGMHFHWFPDYLLPADDPIQLPLRQMLQRAVLDLDYQAHHAHQKRIAAAILGKTLRVSTPDGTDLQFSIDADAWCHLNDGHFDRTKQLDATCARDREEELPCGAIRIIPRSDSVSGIIAYRSGQGIAGTLDLSEYTDNLDFVVSEGRITEVRGGPRNAELQSIWGDQTGDYDRISEVVFGSNPLLTTLPGLRLPPYWGFGSGCIRFHTGSNIESGGRFTSSLSLELFNSDATVWAGRDCLIKDGQLLVP